MTKYIYIAVLLVGFLTSCTSQKGTIGCDGIMRYSQIDTTQTDSVLFATGEYIYPTKE